ncbi:uncharacterized protein B0H18DRAFT_449348 [Fomitopsis serialis]|uniref:uncharacterized protein n=1 Tax=Fomitopsis serialis TaxID=139415 RepID=UPI0020080E0F|nr:uncharacterized protein B0H18DRAFT_449348 [Neoantrodia serialis]KAH9923819.1 hypothetical protein B0H18DRAFT_449348 [Neoantrodia serialis]
MSLHSTCMVLLSVSQETSQGAPTCSASETIRSFAGLQTTSGPPLRLTIFGDVLKMYNIEPSRLKSENPLCCGCRTVNAKRVCITGSAPVGTWWL